MPDITIIIPVFKAEKFIKRCLDSVIAQTFQNWECLLIIDGSPDSSRQICDNYSLTDPRFKVYNKENGGPSSARNYGLDRAEGSYVCFIDSDDYISPFFLEHLVSPMISNTSIKITVTGIQHFGFSSNRFPKEPYYGCIGSKEVFSKMLSGRSPIIKGWLCNKCFKRDIIGKYRMNQDLFYCEDLEMLLRMLYEQPLFDVLFIDEYDYYYNIQETDKSLSHNNRIKVSMISKFNKCLDLFPNSKSKKLRLIKGCLTQCRSLATLTQLNKEDAQVIRTAKKTFVNYFFLVLRYYNCRQILHIVTILISFRLYKYLKYK